MKKIILFVSVIFIGTCYGQTKFEKGYLIDNKGQRIDCFIKNFDWMKNPEEFVFKLNENSAEKVGHIDQYTEFGVSEFIFKRFTVEIDRSSLFLSSLDTERNPAFKSEVLYLKLLVHGDAQLYEYVDRNLDRYFYGTDSNKVEQLVYKKYLKSDSKVGTNNLFKQQLLNHVNCNNTSNGQLEKLHYSSKELILYFEAYNHCKNPKKELDGSKKKKGEFHLSIRPGINLNNFEITRESADFETSSTGFQLGVEAEYVFPFKHGKWAFLIEPTYVNFNSKSNNDSFSDFKYIALDFFFSFKRLYIQESATFD